MQQLTLNVQQRQWRQPLLLQTDKVLQFYLAHGEVRVYPKSVPRRTTTFFVPDCHPQRALPCFFAWGTSGQLQQRKTQDIEASPHHDWKITFCAYGRNTAVSCLNKNT